MKLDEIKPIGDPLDVKGYEDDDIIWNSKIKVAKQGMNIYKYETVDDNLSLYTLENEDEIHASIIATTTTTGYTMIRRTWVDLEYRNLGRMASLYRGLYKYAGLKLISDAELTNASIHIWKNIGDIVKVIDIKTGNEYELDDEEIQDRLYDDVNIRFLLENYPKIISEKYGVSNNEPLGILDPADIFIDRQEFYQKRYGIKYLP